MIYFITARAIGRVKIGYSSNPAQRFSKVQTDSPVALALERICAGKQRDEARLHARFAHYRIGGEWFALSEEIEAFMRSLPPYEAAPREASLAQIIIAATGLSKGRVSQILKNGGVANLPIPIALAVFEHSGMLLGPLEQASAEEVATLQKFCGAYRKGTA